MPRPAVIHWHAPSPSARTAKPAATGCRCAARRRLETRRYRTAHLAAERVAVHEAAAAGQHVRDGLEAAVRVGWEALGQDDRREERPEEVERPERVAVVHEQHKRVALDRIELHRTDCGARGGRRHVGAG
eukprot:4576792-Prymnesium_polylepis.1